MEQLEVREGVREIRLDADGFQAALFVLFWSLRKPACNTSGILGIDVLYSTC